MDLGSLLRQVAGGRRRTTGYGPGGHGAAGGARPTAGGGIGETVGRAVDGEMGRRRGRTGSGGLGGALRRFGRGRI